LIAIFCWTALLAGSESRMPVFPSEEGTEYSLILRAGAGADTNVLRDPDASARGALLRADLRGEAEPLPELHLLADGVFEGDVADQFIYQGEGSFIADYHRALGEVLALRLGSISQFLREPTVFVEGQVLRTGAALRTEVGERLSAQTEAALGPLDVDLGGRGEVTSVSGIENFTLFDAGLSAGLRVIALESLLSLRARYTFDAETLSGLPTRDLDGEILPGAPSASLGVHGIRGAVRLSPASWFNAALHADQEWYVENGPGFLSGDRQLVRAELYFERGPLAAELAGELGLRRYPTRHPTLDNPASERTIDAWLDVDVWLGRHFGIYVRYQIEQVSADPGGQIFIRHLISIGPAGRVRSGSEAAP
jgi:hypothetical protein